MNIQIYALLHPDTKSIFYIGRTSVNYISRYGGHIEAAYNPRAREYDSDKYKEFRKVVSESGKFPVPKLLEEVDVFDNTEAGIIEASYVLKHLDTVANSDYSYIKTKVYRFNLQGKLIASYANILEAKQALRLNTYETSNLQKVLTGERKLLKGNLWSFNNRISAYSTAISKEVHMYTKEGKYMTTFACAREVVNHHPSLRTKIISQVCKGDKSTHGGYRFSYTLVDKLPELVKKKRDMRALRKPILRFDLNMNFIKEYPCASGITDIPYVDSGSISKACRGLQGSYKGYIWRYK